MKVGFIGLGIMGTPMAGYLIKAGHDVYLYSIPSIPEALVAAGGGPCRSGNEVAQAAEFIIPMAPDTPRCSMPAASPKASAPARWWST